MCIPDGGATALPNACAYIRLILPLSLPEISGRYNVLFGSRETVGRSRPDLVITQRLAFADDGALDNLLKWRDVLGFQLVYDLDDDLMSIGPEHAEYAFYRRSTANLRRIVVEADQVWASTEVLRERLARLGARAVVIPNALDPRLWRPEPVTPPAGPVRVWSMGTNTHRDDFERIVAPAARAMKREFGDAVAFTVIGASDQVSPDWELVQCPHAIAASYPAFVRWLHTLPRPHLGLAPLSPSPFNNAKSRIKQLEYAALGAATLATAAGEYPVAIAPEVDGLLLAPRAEAFEEALRALLLDRERLQRLREGAARAAQRALQANGDRFAALAGLLERAPAHLSVI